MYCWLTCFEESEESLLVLTANCLEEEQSIAMTTSQSLVSGILYSFPSTVLIWESFISHCPKEIRENMSFIQRKRNTDYAIIIFYVKVNAIHTMQATGNAGHRFWKRTMNSTPDALHRFKHEWSKVWHPYSPEKVRFFRQFQLGVKLVCNRMHIYMNHCSSQS